MLSRMRISSKSSLIVIAPFASYFVLQKQLIALDVECAFEIWTIIVYIWGSCHNGGIICSQCVAQNNRVSFYVFISLIFILEMMLFDFKASFIYTQFWPLKLLHKLFSPILSKL